MEMIEFYPTPDKLIEKMVEGVDFRKVKSVLEPSAGKGNIVKYIKEKSEIQRYGTPVEIDCIEKDETLQNTLIGAGYRLIYDDFLTFSTWKNYDLILMNPPFSNADKHLLKAIEMQKETGGDIICIINAETIRNRYSNTRKVLMQELDAANAVIEFRTDEFKSAERTTNVEIALIKLHYEAPTYTSNIFENLKKKYYEEAKIAEMCTDVAPNDFIETIVRAYQLEVEAGVKFIQEYYALLPHFDSDVKKDNNTYSYKILELKGRGFDLSVNGYVKECRMKYWRALFNDPRITGKMTTNHLNDFRQRVTELGDYEFNRFNIMQLQIEMNKHLIHGIEECIIKLFDDLTFRHSYNDEYSNNIHYFTGWKTNESWIINSKKCIIPLNAYSSWSGNYEPDWNVAEKLADIEKALNYLDGGISTGENVRDVLNAAKQDGKTKNISFKYFDITFYKKGTCHIYWKDQNLMKKFNIFGSQKKGWLPPSYAKKAYNELTEEERIVIDDFEGEKSYNDTIRNPKYYAFVPSNMLRIEEKSA